MNPRGRLRRRRGAATENVDDRIRSPKSDRVRCPHSLKKPLFERFFRVLTVFSSMIWSKTDESKLRRTGPFFDAKSFLQAPSSEKHQLKSDDTCDEGKFSVAWTPYSRVAAQTFAVGNLDPLRAGGTRGVFKFEGLLFDLNCTLP